MRRLQEAGKFRAAFWAGHRWYEMQWATATGVRGGEVRPVRPGEGVASQVGQGTDGTVLL